MPDCNYGVLLYCTTETHVIRFPVSPKQGKQHTEAEARPICTSTYSFRVARKCIQSAVTGTRNSRIGLININSLSVSDFDFFFRGHGRRVAIHDRLAAVIEALWSPLTGNCCAMLGLWMVMGKCGAGGSEPPNDQRDAHAVAVEHADGEPSGVRQHDHVGKLGGVDIGAQAVRPRHSPPRRKVALPSFFVGKGRVSVATERR